MDLIEEIKKETDFWVCVCGKLGIYMYTKLKLSNNYSFYVLNYLFVYYAHQTFGAPEGSNKTQMKLVEQRT